MTDPARIGGLIAQLASDLGIEHPMESARLFWAWDAIVGADVAAKCKPTGLKDGVLKVRTPSAAWAAQFKYLAPEVIKRVNTELGRQVVKDIKPWVETHSGRRQGGS